MRTQNPDELADHVLEYLRTYFYVMYECRIPSNTMPACKNYRSLDEDIRGELIREYDETMTAWGIEINDIAHVNLIYSIKQKVRRYSIAVSEGGTAMSNMCATLHTDLAHTWREDHPCARHKRASASHLAAHSRVLGHARTSHAASRPAQPRARLS